MKKLQTINIKYKDINIKQREASKLRGYFANKYKNIEEMHNHKAQGFIYQYPKIQYKVISNNPFIIGIEKGADILHSNEIAMQETMTIGKEENLVSNEIEILYSKQNFGICKEFIEYEFITPWMALNQDNAKKYKTMDYENKMIMLTRILIGNILSCAKAFDCTIEEEIQVGLDIEETNVNFKNNSMIGFKGRFCTNFCLPDYIGLGKSCSRGFGTIKVIK